VNAGGVFKQAPQISPVGTGQRQIGQ